MFCLKVFSFTLFITAESLPFVDDNPEAITLNAQGLLHYAALLAVLDASIIMFDLCFEGKLLHAL
jgi:hypothetical protein